jgi:hypothetical protein
VAGPYTINALVTDGDKLWKASRLIDAADLPPGVVGQAAPVTVTVAHFGALENWDGNGPPLDVSTLDLIAQGPFTRAVVVNGPVSDVDRRITNTPLNTGSEILWTGNGALNGQTAEGWTVENGFCIMPAGTLPNGAPFDITVPQPPVQSPWTLLGDLAPGITASVGVVAPATPSLGDIFYNTNDATFNIYDGAAWQAMKRGPMSTVGTSAPNNPEIGDFWYRTNRNGRLRVYDGTKWLENIPHYSRDDLANRPAWGNTDYGDFYDSKDTGQLWYAGKSVWREVMLDNSPSFPKFLSIAATNKNQVTKNLPFKANTSVVMSGATYMNANSQLMLIAQSGGSWINFGTATNHSMLRVADSLNGLKAERGFHSNWGSDGAELSSIRWASGHRVYFEISLQYCDPTQSILKMVARGVEEGNASYWRRIELDAYINSAIFPIDQIGLKNSSGSGDYLATIEYR